MSGYDLKQFIDRSTSNFWHAELSQIYTTLKTLEKEGLIICTSVAQEKRPDRRVYTITPEGSQHFADWLHQPFTEVDPYKDTLLLKIFFSGDQDKTDILAQLDIQRNIHQKIVEKYQAETAGIIAKTMEHAPHLRKHALMWEATRRFGEIAEVAYLRWLDETIQMVQENF